MAAVVLLDKALFRQLFPEFADPAAYPDAVLQARWDGEATVYVTDSNVGDLVDSKRAYAISCMLAHLLRLSKVLNAGAPGAGSAGVVVAATVDKVSVTLQPPPSRGEWGYWLAQTPYGQQLSALLSAQAAGGFYVGGNAERSGFRKVGGIF